MNPNYKDRLFQITQQKDSEGIKSFLDDLPKTEKGDVFEWYLAELYRGNGWLAEIKGGRGDRGADILLYHPKTPSRVSLITQAKNHAIPLTFDQTKIELVKFEEQAAPKYNCQQFNLVSVNGFVEDAEKLSEFNMLLYGWDYVAGLIKGYDPDRITEPEIELYAHNKLTYERCKELWQESNYVAVVQATGTGKSYLIAKVMADHLDRIKLVMAPSNYILEQQRSKVPWASDSTNFMTYAKGANLTDKEIKDLNANLIVLDEFHRCGAEIWGAGVQRILDAHPDSYVFGTTATPIRYLDAYRDMRDELFDNVVAEELPLAEAIVRKILPAPTYVAALYTLEEEIDEMMEILAKSKKSDIEKKEIAAEINQIKLNWEKTSGVPQIFKKHLKREINKFIIFCKDQEHLDQMEVEVQRWFQKAGTHRWRKIYRVLSADPESDQNLEEFKDAKSKDTTHLLFAIDMLNEGLHISDVGAVILLRPTESPRIFFQQIGRCIAVNVKNAPIIFDLVNNFQSIRANDFLENLREAREAELNKRADFGLEECAPEIRITDETKDILEVFEEISERLSAWEVMFQHLCEYVEREGHAKVPLSFITSGGLRLGRWVGTQRYCYKQNELSKDRIRALEEMPGWTWDIIESQWTEGYENLKEYSDREGHAKVPNRFITSDGFRLGSWIQNRRNEYSKGKLSKDRIRALEEVSGWSWDPIEDQWVAGYERLKEYADREGHAKILNRYITSDGFRLGNWVGNRRNRYKKGKLSEDHIRALEKVSGWTWETIDEWWIEGYEYLKEFVKREGHARVPKGFITSDDFRLGIWAQNRRNKYKLDKLSEDRIRALEAMPGWSWDPIEDKWTKGYECLKEYVDSEGHAKVHAEYISSDGFTLGTWVNTQRYNYKKNALSKDRIMALEEMPSWSWAPVKAKWPEGYKRLKEFADREGDSKVPADFITSDVFKLGSWAAVQRKEYRMGKLSEGRIKALEELEGWSWDIIKDKWIQGYESLKDYADREGHARVARRYTTSDGFRLGSWVINRRKEYRNGKLSKDRIIALERVPGWSWNPIEDKWTKGYSRLKEYADREGHAKVPAKFIASDGFKLGSWVARQRNEYRKGKLSEDRINAMKSIGFEWKIK